MERKRFFLILLTAGHLTGTLFCLSYTVKRHDSLSGISMDFDVSLDRIMVINHLDDDDIYEGQELIIPEWVEQREYRVVSGDSLSAISYAFDIALDKLLAINKLENKDIRVGQRILLPRNPEPGESYVIKRGDTLSWISLLYDIPVTELMAWNGLSDGRIAIGTALCLQPPPSASKRPDDSSPEKSEDLPAAGEYFFQFPEGDSQSGPNYQEMPVQSIREDFLQGKELLEEFERSISNLKKRGNELKDWVIILDPGHGGYDSGAIVSGEDGLGWPVYVVEDEYAYDTALRLYRLLRLHEAAVYLTVISPNHKIRRGEPGKTFPHQKNEVYNSPNAPGEDAFRPVGTASGLQMRKTLAGEYISRNPGNKSLFLSIHADNSPTLPDGTALIYYGEEEPERAASLSFAETLAANLGSKAFTHEQNVNVLRENPADAAALIETRNLCYKRNCWAIRDPDLREEQAEMIVNGILQYASAR